MKTSRLVSIYVRLNEGDKATRRLSFVIPEGVRQAEGQLDLINMGFAIDGNEAVMIVRPGDRLAEANTDPLSKVLHRVEVGLSHWLEVRGYEVEFK